MMADHSLDRIESSKNNKAIALFDFDGTITAKDSLAEFIRFAVGGRAYYIGLLRLTPILAAYKLKIISNSAAKEKLMACFFYNWDAGQFRKIAEQYSLEHLAKIIRPKAMERIRWHQNQGHKVVIVSASMESWLAGWCERNSIGLISTRLEVKKNKLTGKFSTKNCHGIEKVNRIKSEINLSEFGLIYAYGDSSGDKEMLEIAHKRYYRYFH